MDLQGVFVKIGDSIKFKGFSCGIPDDPKKIKRAPRKSPEKWTFLSLACYNAPSLDTVDHRKTGFGISLWECLVLIHFGPGNPETLAALPTHGHQVEISHLNFLGNETSARNFSDRSFFHGRPRGMSVRKCLFFFRIWRVCPKFLAGCPQGHPAQNFLFGLNFCSRLSDHGELRLEVLVRDGFPGYRILEGSSVGCTRRGSYSAKGVFLPSKRLLSAFYNSPPLSKNPSKNLVFTEIPYKRLLRTLLRSTFC